MGPATLSQVLRHLPRIDEPRLLVGPATSDDAAVYKISDDTALIQTVDFFTPVVDDPYLFGQIAAANSLSDVYAMGGKPFLALNIVCFPNCLSTDILACILKGGADKVAEAGAIVAGGHTVQDDEPKYGLAVAGLVHPEKIMANSGALPGDILVLTKPLGTGIISTAIKGDMASQEAVEAAAGSMSALNRGASEAMIAAGARACTDITGFGLIGHATEMARASRVTITLYCKDLPLLPGVKELAAMGLIPAGAYTNRDYFKDMVRFNDESISPETRAIMYDPQTSGGLLIAINKNNLEKLLGELERLGVNHAVVGMAEKQKDAAVEVI